MAKKQHTFSLESLQQAKRSGNYPNREAVINWLVETYGFQDSDATIYPPHGIQTPPFMAPNRHEYINLPALNAIITALEAIEAKKANESQTPKAEIPESINTLISGHHDFEPSLKDEQLTITAKDYPEFYFSIPYVEGNMAATAMALHSMMETYTNPKDSTSLPSYIRQLKEAENVGLRRIELENHKVLFSLLDGSQSEPLDSPPQQLFQVLKESTERNEALIFEQLEFIGNLQKDFGFTKVEHIPQNHTLTLDHPLFNGTEKELKTHGTDGYLTHQDWEMLQKFAQDTKKEFSEVAPILEFKKAINYRNVSIPEPQQGDSLLVLDAGALIDLSVKRGINENETWLDLLKMTEELPTIGKIIIPDYIADVELRKKACVYNAEGKPEFIDLPSASKIPEALQSYLKHAVRRHVKEDGTVEYLAAPGAKPSGNVIIWETEEGRQEANRIAKARASGETVDLEKGFGTRQISNLIAKELDWKNDVNVITTNLKFMHDQTPPTQTRVGKDVSYDTTFGYMEGEFSARGNEIKTALKLTHTDAREHSKEFLKRRNATNDNLLNDDNIFGGDEARGIRAVMKGAVTKRKELERQAAVEEALTAPAIIVSTSTPTPPPAAEPQPPAVAEETPAPVFASVESTSLGSVLRSHLKLDAKAMAKLVKEKANETQSRVRADTILDKLGRSDVLYTLMEALDNLALEKEKPAPSMGILAAEDLEQAVNRSIAGLIRKIDDRTVFLKDVAKQVNALHGENLQFRKPEADLILSDAERPETRVAAAIRDVLKDQAPDAVTEFDREYFTKRLAAERENRSGEQLRE
jgi:hypothetical protein